MAFSQLPLCSSNQIVRAIKRLGAYAGKNKRGSHASFHREVDGNILTATVI